MRSIAIGLMLILGACSSYESEFNQSRTAYKACLASNPASQCANEKAAMDADLRAVNAYNERRGRGMIVVRE